MKIRIGSRLIESSTKIWSLGISSNVAFENDEMTIIGATLAYLSYINLTKYKFFRVCFELFNPTDKDIIVGIYYFRTGICLQQSTSYSTFVYDFDGVENIIKNFSSNLFS